MAVLDGGFGGDAFYNTIEKEGETSTNSLKDTTDKMKQNEVSSVDEFLNYMIAGQDKLPQDVDQKVKKAAKDYLSTYPTRTENELLKQGIEGYENYYKKSGLKDRINTQIGPTLELNNFVNTGRIVNMMKNDKLIQKFVENNIFTNEEKASYLNLLDSAKTDLKSNHKMMLYFYMALKLTKPNDSKYLPQINVLKELLKIAPKTDSTLGMTVGLDQYLLGLDKLYHYNSAKYKDINNRIAQAQDKNLRGFQGDGVRGETDLESRFLELDEIIKTIETPVKDVVIPVGVSVDDTSVIPKNEVVTEIPVETPDQKIEKIKDIFKQQRIEVPVYNTKEKGGAKDFYQAFLYIDNTKIPGGVTFAEVQKYVSTHYKINAQGAIKELKKGETIGKDEQPARCLNLSNKGVALLVNILLQKGTDKTNPEGERESDRTVTEKIHFENHFESNDEGEIVTFKSDSNKDSAADWKTYYENYIDFIPEFASSTAGQKLRGRVTSNPSFRFEGLGVKDKGINNGSRTLDCQNITQAMINELGATKLRGLRDKNGPQQPISIQTDNYKLDGVVVKKDIKYNLRKKEDDYKAPGDYSIKLAEDATIQRINQARTFYAAKGIIVPTISKDDLKDLYYYQGGLAFKSGDKYYKISGNYLLDKGEKKPD